MGACCENKALNAGGIVANNGITRGLVVVTEH
jgi:hypothetical protein